MSKITEHLSISSEFLFQAEIKLEVPVDMGGQRFVRSLGGIVEGPRVNGKFLPGGSDLITILADGTSSLDIRYCLETDDGAFVMLTGMGRIHVPDDTAALIDDRSSFVALDPTRYYFRFGCTFQTNDDRYAWLARTVAIGAGRITSEGIATTSYELK